MSIDRLSKVARKVAKGDVFQPPRRSVNQRRQDPRRRVSNLMPSAVIGKRGGVGLREQAAMNRRHVPAPLASLAKDTRRDVAGVFPLALQRESVG